MQRWDDVRAVLEEEFAVVATADDRLVLELSDQTVTIELGTAFGEPWLTASAPIVPEEDLVRPHDILELNGILAVGALALVDRKLVLRWSTAIRPLDRATVDRTIRFLAREATRLRSIHERVDAPEKALDFLAD
jgi:hypothetical protein